MDRVTKYIVVSLPPIERLSFQMTKLIESINSFAIKDPESGQVSVNRTNIYLNFLKLTEMAENEKVFASYIHQLIMFGFLDKTTVEKKEKPISRDLLMKQLKLMSKAELAELMK